MLTIKHLKLLRRRCVYCAHARFGWLSLHFVSYCDFTYKPTVGTLSYSLRFSFNLFPLYDSHRPSGKKKLHNEAPDVCKSRNTMTTISRGWVGEACSMHAVYKKCLNLRVKPSNIRSGSDNPLNVNYSQRRSEDNHEIFKPGYRFAAFQPVRYTPS